MNISLCMIVKDEEAHLKKCLESVKDHVDEIVIVDTGSSDSTPEIAQEYADVYDEIEWEGFAKARNHSIDLASGEIFFILDADEEVVNPEFFDEVKGFFDEHELLDGVAVHVHNNLPSEQLLLGDRVTQLRFFWNRPEARYKGRVHNQIAETLQNNPRDKDSEEGGKFALSRMVLNHRGYALEPDELQKKYRARLDDLLGEVKKAEEEGNERSLNYYRYQTANCYFMLKDYDYCLAWVREINWEKMIVENTYSALIIGAHSAHMLHLPEDVLEYTRMMIDTRPEEALSFLFMGMAYMTQERWLAAYTYLGSTIAIADRLGDTMKYHLDIPYACAAAGECALRLERLEEAKNLFREHLAFYPDNERIARLEKGIISIDDATDEQLREAGIDPAKLNRSQEIELGEGEEIEIPSNETTHSQPQSEQNHLDETVPK